MKKWRKYAINRQIVQKTSGFLDLHPYTISSNLRGKKGVFYGWGRKKSGLKAVVLAKKHQTSFVLLEDGFIRSIGLGVEGSPSFSIVEDDIGIYYDATAPSKLEHILNTYDFVSDTKLMEDAANAMALMRKHNISKYNNAPLVDESFLSRYGMRDRSEKRILIIAQTAGDASLEYGMARQFSTTDMIESALEENPDAKLYLKVHPDVLSGKKGSDIDIAYAKKHCILIEENINPISLLKYFSKVYTKTSGMGFEALIVGCECVCFGVPYYAGWGVTTDKITCPRRTRLRSVEEIFAATYILYSRYYNPYKQRDSDIFDTIEEIVAQRDRL